MTASHSLVSILHVLSNPYASLFRSPITPEAPQATASHKPTIYPSQPSQNNPVTDPPDKAIRADKNGRSLATRGGDDVLDRAIHLNSYIAFLSLLRIFRSVILLWLVFSPFASSCITSALPRTELLLSERKNFLFLSSVERRRLGNHFFLFALVAILLSSSLALSQSFALHLQAPR